MILNTPEQKSKTLCYLGLYGSLAMYVNFNTLGPYLYNELPCMFPDGHNMWYVFVTGTECIISLGNPQQYITGYW